MTFESLQAIVKGSVQGVGFRYFVLTRARQLELNGYTRNLSDGSVEVYAEGDRKVLEDLLRLLEQGSDFSRVEHVEAVYGKATRRIHGFIIR